MAPSDPDHDDSVRPDPAQYDTFAAGYEAFAEVAPYNAHYDRPATLALVGDVAGQTVFDAGCGPGFYVAEFLARGAIVMGCDGSGEMVTLASERVAGAADLRTHSLDDPLDWVDDGSVDVVVCALAYHYVTDRMGLLREVRRILATGGRMVISTVHPMADLRRLGGPYFAVRWETQTWSEGWEVGSWILPLSTMTEEFAAAGFVISRLIEPLPAPTMAETHPEVFARLSREPDFVLFEIRPSER